MKEFFIDSDGIKLHAKLERPNESEKGPLCILVHGFTGNMEEEHLLAARDAFLDSNISVLRVEMYGHGQSEGTFGEHTLYKWVGSAVSAIQYAKKLDFVTDLYFAGHSQGGLLTMLIGGMYPDLFKAIIPLSPAWNIPEETRNGLMLGHPFELDNIPKEIAFEENILHDTYIRVAQTIYVEPAIERFTGPVLIVHGVDDDCIAFENGEKAAKLYKNATLVPVEHADHCFVGHEKELYNAIIRFL